MEQALAATGTATLRRRRLPAEQVIWLVLGMALMRDWPIEEVVTKLDLALPGANGAIARSAIPQARARLGDEPMQWLFEHGGAMGDGRPGFRDTPRNRAVTAWPAACGVGALWPARLAPRVSSTRAVAPRGRRSTSIRTCTLSSSMGLITKTAQRSYGTSSVLCRRARSVRCSSTPSGG
ncbi:transposase domain-containing protein [Sorangium sp. So ce233]|uniref:transposase domain-containing protein n=1 Tax=Sorangium sp. So ce233 TaxID=3133290 RepID=UPI003F621D2D